MAWIDTISKTIDKVFSVVRAPLPFIPPILLLCEILNRPGLSAISLAASIIQRLPEAGIVTTLNKDGSPSKTNQFVRIIAEETVKEIKNNLRISSVIEPGSIVSMGTGGNAGGPVVIFSTNMLPTSAHGLGE